MLATVFALMLWYEFNRVVAEKRDEAVREIRNQQMQLYPAAKALAALAPRECLDLLERIDAMERLIDVIRKRRPGGWQKMHGEHSSCRSHSTGETRGRAPGRTALRILGRC